ncbi:long-chain fatty acid transporter [Aureimonas fodinaquatilis]|uniref:Long-chain fatty acid transporter n=1 Tax=Aureimonas fodinaquatilis TaxID=2565783 RepID=A0A5B0DW94_9HYPH|nr:long-chain fatty acid transporter [Aureimonas fodinaquatilis]KAA0970703.1 long-chain fatty acid transporter [Aureimonas fodinaquatilis]
MLKLSKILGSASLLTLASLSAAQAGGFQRSTADTDILYEPGMVSMRTGMTYVSPERGFDSINGVSGSWNNYTGSYNLPTASLKFGDGPVACAGSYAESFAAEADYSSLPGGAQPISTTGSRVQSLEFNSNEWSATCRLSYEADVGRFSLLAGLFVEDFNFQGTSLGAAPTGRTGPGGAPVLVPVALSVDTSNSYETGYRVGFAYEKPEIALRAQVLYRSEIKHDRPEGTGYAVTTGDAFIINPATGGTVILPPSPLLPVGTQVSSGTAFQNTVISPQSLYVNFQTGIAEGTLLVGSFRWTDWSTNRNVLTSYVSAIGTSVNNSPYYWDDGYTATIGIGKAFNENISGLVTLGYDSGVSTGAETTYTDLYSLSGGLSFKQGFGEIRFGGLVGYWTSGSQSVANGAIFDATVGNDWVFAGNASIKLTF